MLNNNNISLDQARYIMLQKYPNLKLISVVDYDVLYVFNTMLKDYDPKTDEIAYDGLKAVRKDDGRVLTFIPLQHNPEEYATAVERTLKQL